MSELKPGDRVLILSRQRRKPNMRGPKASLAGTVASVSRNGLVYVLPDGRRHTQAFDASNLVLERLAAKTM